MAARQATDLVGILSRQHGQTDSHDAIIEDASFRNVGWKAIRKRSSKKELFEYVVHANAP